MPHSPLHCEQNSSAIDWGAELTAHEGWLRKVILARTGESQAVDEVFQQVAVAALEQRSPIRESARVAPWLHRIAVIQSARYRRKLGRQKKAIGTIADRQVHLGNGYAKDVLSLVLNKERHELIQLALARLVGADAEILLLKYGERWSYRQIAERLGISEKAVDSRLMRARDRFRHELVAAGMGEEER